MNRDKIKADIRAHEGTIDHFYLDTRGNVTVGVGQLVATVAFAQTLPLIDRASGQPASAEAIAAEFANVAAQAPGLIASRYRPFTQLALPAAAIEQLLEQRVDEFVRDLGGKLDDFERFPDPAQEALMDMAFNLGVGGLTRKFPKLIGAAQRQDWGSCAAECDRRGINDERNAATRALFQRAAGTA